MENQNSIKIDRWPKNLLLNNFLRAKFQNSNNEKRKKNLLEMWTEGNGIGIFWKLNYNMV